MITYNYNYISIAMSSDTIQDEDQLSDDAIKLTEKGCILLYTLYIISMFIIQLIHSYSYSIIATLSH